MNLNVIRTLTMRSKVEGAAESKAALKGVQSAYEGLAKVTETSAKGQLSLADAVSKAERRFNTSLRAQQDFEKVQRQMNLAVAQNPALQERANAVLALARTHFDQASKGSHAYGAAMQAASAQASAMASRLGPLGGLLSALGPAGVAAAAAIGVITGASVKAVATFGKLEEHQLTLNSMLKSTGFAAGRTADDIERMATEIGNISEVRKAAIELVKFGSISKDVFDRTLVAADDLSAAGFGSISSAAEALGKALESPADGLTRLRRAGIIFSDAQIAMVKNMQETGRLAEAQRFILDELAKKVGGAGAARDQGLAGSYEALGDATQRLLENWGRQITEGLRLTSVIKGLADAADQSNKVAASPSLKLAGVETGIQGAQRRIAEAPNRGVRDAAEATLNRLLQQRETLLGQVAEAEKKASAARSEATQAADNAAEQRRIDLIKGMVAEIDKETESLKKNAFQRAVDIELRKAQAANDNAPGRGDVEKAVNIKMTTEATEQFIDATKLQAANLNITAKSMGMNATAAARYKIEQEMLVAVLLKGNTLSDEQHAAIKKVANEFGAATAKVEAFKAAEAKRGRELTGAQGIEMARLELSLVGETQEAQERLTGQLRIKQQLEQEAAQTKIPVDQQHLALLQDQIAQQARLNELTREMNMLNQTLSEAFKGFRDDVNRGIEPLKALENQLVRISDRIVNMGLDNLIKSQLGAVFGGGIDMSQSIRAGVNQSQQDFTAAQRAGSGFAGPAGQTMVVGPMQGAQPGAGGAYVMGGLAAVGAGVSAYRGGQASASPGQAALSGGFSGAMAGAAAGAMIGSVVPVIGTVIGAIGGAVIGGLGGAGLGFMGGQSGQAQQQREREEQNRQAYSSLQTQILMLSADTNTRQGSRDMLGLQQVDQRRQLQSQNVSAGVLEEAEQLFRQQKLVLEQQWNAKELAEKEQHLQALADLRRSFDDRVFAATTDTSTLQGAMLAFDRRAAQERIQVAKEFAEALPDLDRALAAERLQIQNDFATRAAEAAQARLDAIAQRQQSFGDQLFGILNDTSTLQGQLAADDLQTMREREAEQKAGGDALVQFDLFAMARRLKVIQDFGRAAVEAEERAAEDRQNAINAAARNVVEYINGLMSGTGSTLSPGNRLAAATAAYNSQITLAQGGNTQAAASITQHADNLLKSARDYFGSAAGYQQIFSAVTSQLLALPAVQSSSDPVVNALRDAIDAIQATTSAVGGTTNAVGTVKGAVDSSKITISEDLTIQKGVLDIINTSTTATNASTAATKVLQDTANDYLLTSRDHLDTTVHHLETANLSLNVLQEIASNIVDQTDTQQTSFDELSRYTRATAGMLRNVLTSANPITFTQNPDANLFAQGGVLQPGLLGIFGEHHPQGPFFARAGASPIPISPNMPGNVIPFPGQYGGGQDNGAIVAELRRLNEALVRRIDQLEQRLVQAEVAGATHVGERVDKVQGDTSELRRAGNMRR